MQDPSIGVVTYQYDAVGNKTAVTDNLGQTMNFTFDALNRITERKSAAGNRTQFFYDDTNFANSIGKLTKVVDPARTIEFSYNQRGRKTNEAVRFKDLPAIFTRNWVYDQAGRVRSETFPQFGPEPATVQTYEYTPAGNLFQVKVDGAIYAQWDGYNALGKAASRTLDPGQASEVVTNYNYDILAKLNQVQVFAAQGSEIQNINYSFDKLGNITKIDDQTQYFTDDEDDDHHDDEENKSQGDEHKNKNGHFQDSQAKLSANQIFEYDLLDRLSQASGAYGSKSYSFDLGGNMTQIGAKVDRTLTYEGDRLVAGTRLEVTYDGLGNMSGKYQDGVQWGYKFNSLGHLAQVHKNGNLLQTNAYDFTGQRILQRVYSKNNSKKIHTTFYPTSGVVVRHDHNKNTFTVNKTISAGSHGKLASFEEKFVYKKQDEAGQYFAYADIFNSGSTGGWVSGQFYSGLGHMSQPWVSRAILPSIFSIFSLLLLGTFLLAMTREM